MTCPTNVFLLSDSPLINCSTKVRAHVSSLVPQWNMRNGIAREYCLSQMILFVKGTKTPVINIKPWTIEMILDDITLYSIYPGNFLAAHPALQNIDSVHVAQTTNILNPPTFNAIGPINAIFCFVLKAMEINMIKQQMLERT